MKQQKIWTRILKVGKKLRVRERDTSRTNCLKISLRDWTINWRLRIEEENSKE